jgi:hypothetical protein
MVEKSDTGANFNLLLSNSWLIVEDDRASDRGLARLS